MLGEVCVCVWGEGGGEGDIIGLGEVDRLENAVFVCTCGSVCVCYAYVFVCAGLVGGYG